MDIINIAINNQEINTYGIPENPLLKTYICKTENIKP